MTVQSSLQLLSCEVQCIIVIESCIKMISILLPTSQYGVMLERSAYSVKGIILQDEVEITRRLVLTNTA